MRVSENGKAATFNNGFYIGCTIENLRLAGGIISGKCRMESRIWDLSDLLPENAEDEAFLARAREACAKYADTPQMCMSFVGVVDTDEQGELLCKLWNGAQRLERIYGGPARGKVAKVEMPGGVFNDCGMKAVSVLVTGKPGAPNFSIAAQEEIHVQTRELIRLFLQLVNA